MIGDLIVFAVIAIAVGGGGIAAGMLVGRRLERRLAGAGEPEAVEGSSGDLEGAAGGLAPPAQAPGGPSGGAPDVEEAR